MTGSAGLSLDAVSLTTVSLTKAVGALSSVFTGSSFLVTVSLTTVSLTISAALTSDGLSQLFQSSEPLQGMNHHKQT